MIENFVVVRRNGAESVPGAHLPGVSLLEQMNSPEYRLVGYRWSGARGEQYLALDAREVRDAKPLPDGSGVVVLQDHETFGADNVVVLDEDKRLLLRVANPYPGTRDFQDGDKYHFYGIHIHAQHVTLSVQVRRASADGGHDVLALYEAQYEPAAHWRLASMVWRPWT